jgi:triacylglycerol lipase
VYEYHTSPSYATCFSGAYDGQALVHETTDGRVVVAFRGTESMRDCMVDLLRYRVRFGPLPMGRVHAGFKRQYEGLHSQIRNYLLPTYGPNKHIIVTGHSLGGALATLFAADIAYNIPTMSVKCYSFCSPRVGDRQFVRCVNGIRNLSILRVNNSYDIIPCLPMIGFVHTPAVKYLNAEGMGYFDFRKRHSIMPMYVHYISRSGDSYTRSCNLRP